MQNFRQECMDTIQSGQNVTPILLLHLDVGEREHE